MKLNKTGGWIGVDLDATLAFYDEWRGIEHVGEPITLMLDRVNTWVAAGKRVKIFTARVFEPTSIPHIEAWLEKHGLKGLEITNIKDFEMLELWDDRAVQIVPNTGQSLFEAYAALLTQNQKLKEKLRFIKTGKR